MYQFALLYDLQLQIIRQILRSCLSVEQIAAKCSKIHFDNEAEEVYFRLQGEESYDNVRNTHRLFLEDAEHINCATNGRIHPEEDQCNPPYH